MIIHNQWTINQYDFENLKRNFDLNEPYEGAQQLSNIINQVIQQLVTTINAELNMNEIDTYAGEGLNSASGLNGPGGISIDPKLLATIENNTNRILLLEERTAGVEQTVLDLNEAMNTPAPAILEEMETHLGNYKTAMGVLK